MADLGNFNANDHEDMADFSTLPKGWYLVTITADEQKDSKATQGAKYLKLEMTVAEGSFKARKVWNMLNLWHIKPGVVQMAQREMATLCRAVNVLNPTSSNQLHGIPFGIKIGHQKNSQTGEMQERVKAYCSEKEFASKAASNPAPTQPAAQGNGNKASWEQ